MFDDDEVVVARAELILMHAALVAHERLAAESLRGTRGVAFAPLVAEAPVIHAVTVDGRHVGRVRRIDRGRGQERWVAVPLRGTAFGCFESADAAASALAATTIESERWTL